VSTAGIAAVAAHPYQVKLIWQARAKTDPIDARKLADLLRTNLLPVVWVPSLEIRARRKLLRGRAYLVRLRTSVKNRIHGHLTAENCRTEVTDLYGKAGRAWLAAEDCVALRELLSPDANLPVLDDRHVRAHARLLVRWVAIHLGDARLPALEAWQEGVGEG
jgi:transposase